MKKNNIQKKTFVILSLIFATNIGAADFTDNGDGTVSDATTGLVWQKCSRGQNNDSTCSGQAESGTWQTALNYCKNLTLDNRTWRLPSLNELKSILDIGRSGGRLIDTTVFPATPANYFWSASTDITDATSAWYVGFRWGRIFIILKSALQHTRCVSSGP